MSATLFTAPRQFVAYRCPACGDLYRREEDAEDCCPAEDAAAWDCLNPFCSRDRLHESSQDAERCAGRVLCICGHEQGHHARSGQWPGCYDLDCRCAAFEVAS